jgi:hypothetical protein
LTIMPGLTLPLPAVGLSLQAVPTLTRVHNLTNRAEEPGFDNNAWPYAASPCGRTVSKGHTHAHPRPMSGKRRMASTIMSGLALPLRQSIHTHTRTRAQTRTRRQGAVVALAPLLVLPETRHRFETTLRYTKSCSPLRELGVTGHVCDGLSPRTPNAMQPRHGSSTPPLPTLGLGAVGTLTAPYEYPIFCFFQSAPYEYPIFFTFLYSFEAQISAPGP